MHSYSGCRSRNSFSFDLFRRAPLSGKPEARLFTDCSTFQRTFDEAGSVRETVPHCNKVTSRSPCRIDATLSNQICRVYPRERSQAACLNEHDVHCSELVSFMKPGSYTFTTAAILEPATGGNGHLWATVLRLSKQEITGKPETMHSTATARARYQKQGFLLKTGRKPISAAQPEERHWATQASTQLFHPSAPHNSACWRTQPKPLIQTYQVYYQN